MARKKKVEGTVAVNSVVDEFHDERSEKLLRFYGSVDSSDEDNDDIIGWSLNHPDKDENEDRFKFVFNLNHCGMNKDWILLDN